MCNAGRHLAQIVIFLLIIALAGVAAAQQPVAPPNPELAPPPQQNAGDPPPQQPRQPQQPAPAPAIAIDAVLEVLPHGDVKGQVIMDMADAQYAEMKRVVPDPALFLRDLRSRRADFEMSADSTARYDDQKTAVVMDVCELGAIRNLGKGRWILPVDEELEFLNFNNEEDGRISCFFLYKAENNGGIETTGQAIMKLPAAASDPAYDAPKRVVTYRLPAPEVSGTGSLDVGFDARDRIMSALYKIYGLETDFAAQWVGKAVFRNTGTGLIENLRVRYRVDGYSEWSLWQKFPQLVPGQTVVSVYYPVLDRKIAALHSTTPANVRVEYRYDTPGQARTQDEDGERIAILGVHEFIFSNLENRDSLQNWADSTSNAPFLAAWVSRDDPVVSRFAAMANKLAGGEGAPYSDEAAYKVLKACYELWLGNDFTYQGPKAITNDNLSFDSKVVQSIRYPREVIRDKSGTCIELTTLYCSMAHAVGLKAFVILIPGHAFPAVRLPSGKILALESTGVGGGLRHGARSFEDMIQVGAQNLEKSMQKGLIMDVDAESLWAQGVSNPELGAVAANALNEWGIVAKLAQGTAQGDVARRDPNQEIDPNQLREIRRDDVTPTPPEGPGTPHNGPVTPEQRPQHANLAGSWQGMASEPTGDGRVMNYPVSVTIVKTANGYQATAEAVVQMADNWGNVQTIVVYETYQGTFDGQTLRLRGTQKTVRVRETGQVLPATLDDLEARLQGSQLQGRAGTPTTGYTSFTLQRTGGR